MTLLDDFNAYISDVSASTLYKKWASGSPGEVTQWQGVVSAIRGGNRPPLPTLASAFGRSLIDEARLYLDATAAPAPTPTPTPTPVSSTVPFKGCSPGSKIKQATDNLTWELPEIVTCFGTGAGIRIDSGNDTVVQAAIDAGLKVILLVGGTLRTVPSVAQHAADVAAYAAKWKGHLFALEVGGNEPNINPVGGQTPQQNADLINAASAAARNADPAVQVVAGGLAPATNMLTFATSLIPLLAAGSIDHFAPHLYEDAANRQNWNNWDKCFHPETMGGALTVRQLLDNLPGGWGKNVYISSGESGGYVPTIGEANQNVYVKNAYADFKARRTAGERVGYLLTFTMRDDENAPGWGLCRVDHTRRPAWTTAQAATR